MVISFFDFILESEHRDYLSWKRKNVTIRGIKDRYSDDNNGMAKYGSGLYTAFLGNKQLAKQYGHIYFVVNAIPKSPKVVYNTNEAEWLLQNIITNYCKEHGVPRSNIYFNDNTSIPAEMLKLGYDGLIIKGREIVNYNPPANVLYFENEHQLYTYYENSNKLNINENLTTDVYIYHGTGKGQALSIQRDGYMKPNNTGESQPSVSFTEKLDYAKYYAKSKGGNNAVILRTLLDSNFILSSRIYKNNGYEYITYDKIPSSKLEILTSNGDWKSLDSWNIIFNEPL